MARLLRTIGLLLIAAWAFLLLAREKFDLGSLPQQTTVLAAGLLALAAGVVLGLAGRAGRLVRRPRCARCRRPVQPGEIYCAEHFRETLDRMRDRQPPT